MSIMKMAAPLILGTAVLGCSHQPVHSVSEIKQAKAAEVAAARANKAMLKKNYVAAVTFAEEAVAAAPRDAAYRVLLARAYMKAGRFASAQMSFSDVLHLRPDDGQAALNLALTEIALGRQAQGRTTIEQHRDKLSASDFGLASALAGDVDTAVAVLEAAIRAPGADAKTRQNLALAYAFAGKWTNARIMAVQDVTADEADARILEWMTFVRPENASRQVAMLLGVTAVADSGQPTRLALAPVKTTVAMAANIAIPAAAPVMVQVPPMPVMVVTAPSATAPVVVPAPVYSPAILAAAMPASRAVPIVNKPAVTATKKAPAKPATVISRVSNGRFVVQLGAFENVAVAETSWKRLSGKLGLAGYEPANSLVRVNEAMFVRLSVGGFVNRPEAVRVCWQIQTKGGTCFVRTTLGDTTAAWVKPGSPKFAAR